MKYSSSQNELNKYSSSQNELNIFKINSASKQLYVYV